MLNRKIVKRNLGYRRYQILLFVTNYKIEP